jgi:hypothetical protein
MGKVVISVVVFVFESGRVLMRHFANDAFFDPIVWPVDSAIGLIIP